jgi:lipopolysaccharide biosynthesis regulator YciM
MRNHYAENAESWWDIGARLFAESVVENDRAKLFKAINYLEKAKIGEPDNAGITVDLADAYMRLNSPSLTAIAINMYKSVMKSPNDDPILSRLATAYAQLGNKKAALAFAKERMKRCPDENRVAAATQLSYLAVASLDLNSAISAILADMEKRGDKPALALIVAALKAGNGDKSAALALIDVVLSDKTLKPSLKNYAETMRRRIENE